MFWGEGPCHEEVHNIVIILCDSMNDDADHVDQRPLRGNPAITPLQSNRPYQISSVKKIENLDVPLISTFLFSAKNRF